MKYIIQYGKQVDTTKLDDEGSYVVEEKTIMDFKEVDNKQRFEIRVKVHDEKEELSEYLQFRTDTKDMANAEFLSPIIKKKQNNGLGYKSCKVIIDKNEEEIGRAHV